MDTDTEKRYVLIRHCYFFQFYALSVITESLNTNDSSNFIEVLTEKANVSMERAMPTSDASGM